jgi:chromosomal replication initiator protein
LIDGILQFDIPHGPAATAAGPLPPVIVGGENSLLVPVLSRLLDDGEITAVATQFVPLVLVGPSGSGKTHIVQGLMRAWARRLDASQIAYFTAADFGREFQAAQADHRLDAWRAEVRSVRLLVVEDADRLRPQAPVQRELRHTIDAIIGGGVIVITALREPTALGQLDAGLRDRLTAGLSIRLHRPGHAARRAILAAAATARGLSLDAESLNRLALRECDTVAQLLGRLADLCTSGSTSTTGMAGTADESATQEPRSSPVRRDLRDREQRALLKQIVAVTARYFGFTQAALIGPSRRASLVQTRNIVVHLARRLTSLSYAEIGRVLGNRDHTTMMHADRRAAARLASDFYAQEAMYELDRVISR